MSRCQWDMRSWVCLQTRLQVRWIVSRRVYMSSWFTWAAATHVCAFFLCFNTLDLRPKQAALAGLSDYVLEDSRAPNERTAHTSNRVFTKKRENQNCISWSVLSLSNMVDIFKGKGCISYFSLFSRRRRLGGYLWNPLMTPLTRAGGAAGLLVLFWLKPVWLTCLSSTVRLRSFLWLACSFLLSLVVWNTKSPEEVVEIFAHCALRLEKWKLLCDLLQDLSRWAINWLH